MMLPLPETDGTNLRRLRPISEINVTPMVDVMLVLLIIFMVAAPLLTSGVQVNLPKASAAPAITAPQAVVVNVMADGALLVNRVPVSTADLVAAVKAQLPPDHSTHGGPPAPPIYVQGDRDVTYDHVIGAIDALALGGLARVVLVVDRSPQAGAH